MQQETFFDIIERTGGFPVHCAHRGGGGTFAPENTMLAFRKAVQYGARLLETDIWLTRDDELVLMHWSNVAKTTNGRGHIGDYTLAELRELDAAFYTEWRDTGVRVPTLREFLDEFAPLPDMLFLLDFKDSRVAEHTLEFIAPYIIERRIILGAVTGAANALLLEWRDTHPSLRIPVSTDIVQTFEVTLAYWFGALGSYYWKHDIFGYILLGPTSFFWSRGLICAVQASGARVLLSLMGAQNTEDVLRECVESGVDFIMTDRPDLLQRVLSDGKIF